MVGPPRTDPNAIIPLKCSRSNPRKVHLWKVFSEISFLEKLVILRLHIDSGNLDSSVDKCQLRFIDETTNSVFEFFA